MFFEDIFSNFSAINWKDSGIIGGFLKVVAAVISCFPALLSFFGNIAVQYMKNKSAENLQKQQFKHDISISDQEQLIAVVNAVTQYRHFSNNENQQYAESQALALQIKSGGKMNEKATDLCKVIRRGDIDAITKSLDSLLDEYEFCQNHKIDDTYSFKYKVLCNIIPKRGKFQRNKR